MAICVNCVQNLRVARVLIQQAQDSANKIANNEVSRTVPFRCSTCLKEFDDRSALNQHRSTHIVDLTVDNDEKKVKTKKASKYIEHELQVGAKKGFIKIKKYEKRPFVCKICHRNFTERGFLKTHKERHAKCDKEISCKSCDLRFIATTHFKQHKCK